MQQHLGRLDGVLKVEVSLVDGKVTIQPKEDGKLDPLEVIKATYDSGVSVAEMQITATGHLRKDAEKGLLLDVSASQSFPVVANELAEAAQNNTGSLSVTGILYRKPAGKQKKSKDLPPLKLEITSFEPK